MYSRFYTKFFLNYLTTVHLQLGKFWARHNRKTEHYKNSLNIHCSPIMSWQVKSSNVIISNCKRACFTDALVTEQHLVEVSYCYGKVKVKINLCVHILFVVFGFKLVVNENINYLSCTCLSSLRNIFMMKDTNSIIGLWIL